MDKGILLHYKDAQARCKLLREKIEKLEETINKIEQGHVGVVDMVTRGKKGKKPLGIVIVHGYPHKKLAQLKRLLEERREQLENEKMELLELINQVEEYIANINNIEIRNIMTLYYIENMNWMQVSRRMNQLHQYEKTYTDSSCRQKHNYFLEKE